MTVSEQQTEAAARLRAAFSHIETPSCSIAAWLTEEQTAALAAYRSAFGMKASDPAYAPTETDAEQALIRQFAERLASENKLQSEQCKAYASDLRLLQYLRARDLNLDKAYHMLLATLEWRKQNKPWEMENQTSRTDKTVSDARIVGYDVKGRVVVYSSFANTYQRTPKDVQLNAAAMMEKAALCVNAGSPGNLIWVNNFGARHKNGFGWRDCNPAFFFSGIDIFNNHYPECLERMMIVDPPSIFFRVWAVVKPLLALKTQQKAAFIDSRQQDKTKQQLIETFGDELGTFLHGQILRDA